MRGYGGVVPADWATATGPTGTLVGISPIMTASFKYADTVINSTRTAGTGIYRARNDGNFTNGPYFISSNCTYAHTTLPPTACHTAYSNVGLSTIVYNSLFSGFRGIAFYGVSHAKFTSNDARYGAWMVGPVAEGTEQTGGTAGANITLWVR